MKPDEMLKAMLLEFDVTFAALIATLVAKNVFTMEELNQAKVIVRPVVEEKGKEQSEILKKAMDKENPLKDLMDIMKDAVEDKKV